MHRGQASILLLAVLLPAGALGALGLALLGARVQGERAQRLAEAAALRAARGLAPEEAEGVRIDVRRSGSLVQATVRLRRTPFPFGNGASTGFAARATAVARPIVTADGDGGAVLVG